MPMVVRSLAIATLRHRIVEEVRQAILNGSLSPGERLVERDLATRLGTSLTAAREAIIQLESEGLITKQPNASTHVTKLSPSEIDQIVSVRCVLEEYACAEAARLGTTKEVDNLNRIYQEGLKSINSGSGRRYILQDLAWHEAIWEMTHNKYLYESLRRVVLPLFGFSLIAIASKTEFDLLSDARSHAGILKGISQHDPKATRKAYRAASRTWESTIRKAEVQSSQRTASGNSRHEIVSNAK